MSVGQKQFASALLNPELPIPDGVVDPQGRPAGKRFDVYRNNVIFSLLDAMETAFPAIRKQIGADNFRAICNQFVRQHPPNDAVLMFYGSKFPDYLRQFKPLANFPYLPDLAELELARRVSYHAADCTAVLPEVLGNIAPEQLMAAQFQFAPAMHIITSIHPIISLWEFNMIEDAPEPTAAAQNALISRPEFDPEITKITEGTAHFLNLLQAGEPLGSAFEASAEIAPDFDLSAALTIMLQTQIITKIDLPGAI